MLTLAPPPNGNLTPLSYLYVSVPPWEFFPFLTLMLQYSPSLGNSPTFLPLCFSPPLAILPLSYTDVSVPPCEFPYYLNSMSQYPLENPPYFLTLMFQYAPWELSYLLNLMLQHHSAPLKIHPTFFP